MRSGVQKRTSNIYSDKVLFLYICDLDADLEIQIYREFILDIRVSGTRIPMIIILFTILRARAINLYFYFFYKFTRRVSPY